MKTIDIYLQRKDKLNVVSDSDEWQEQYIFFKDKQDSQIFYIDRLCVIYFQNNVSPKKENYYCNCKEEETELIGCVILKLQKQNN
ncbi:unnamed protein product [Paramecium pentaurelia]|uniref:Uncharacterized protein n=1 Tax=Paramecium pentaurelia TaxID=43138 RepID=A0A8S1YIV5_9CILI|nr:unnamed protein product [Paramecium pentaurelia]